MNGWKPKMLREVLCEQQTHAPDNFAGKEIQRLINVLDTYYRPLGSDGKHGDLHTPDCGCEPVHEPQCNERCFGNMHYLL